jgi:hypothetical protein
MRLCTVTHTHVCTCTQLTHMYAPVQNGKTCLHRAVDEGHVDIAEILAGVGKRELTLAKDKVPCLCSAVYIYIYIYIN